jgi:hypothetical protein
VYPANVSRSLDGNVDVSAFNNGMNGDGDVWSGPDGVGARISVRSAEVEMVDMMRAVCLILESEYVQRRMQSISLALFTIWDIEDAYTGISKLQGV